LKKLIGIILAFASSGCLQTRTGLKEADEKTVLRKQLSNLQQTNADTSNKFNEYDDDIKRLGGRIESVEQRIGQTGSKAEKNEQALESKIKAQDEKFSNLKDELSKQNTEISELKTTLGQLQAAINSMSVPTPPPLSSTATGASKKAASQSAFESAMALYDKKNYQEAILKFEEYRKANAKGKFVASATMKIGQSFEILGMRDEAKAFYDEVVGKFPKSKEAANAAVRLKKIRK
jgi:TolA-binding protein